MNDVSTWQDSWKQLWNRFDALSCASVQAWAHTWDSQVLCVPSCASWPTGMLVIQLPDGNRVGFPLTAAGYASKLKKINIAQPTWQTWMTTWQTQQQAWNTVIQQSTEFTVHVIPTLIVSVSS